MLCLLRQRDEIGSKTIQQKMVMESFKVTFEDVGNHRPQEREENVEAGQHLEDKELPEESEDVETLRQRMTSSWNMRLVSLFFLPLF